MFTIETLASAGLLARWESGGLAQPIRMFYFTQSWLTQFNGLPDDYNPKSLVRSTTVRTNLAALVDRYVDGSPRARLARPYSFGSEPIWQRMRPPRKAVVEFKTWDTRTFGFFAQPNVYVACAVGLADPIKRHDLYGDYGDTALKFMTRVHRLEINEVADVAELVSD
jgi:hypothetical protein